MIPAGTTLDFTARGTTEAAQFQLVFTPGMLEAAAAAVLSRQLEVVGLTVTSDDTIITGTLPWTYRADVRVTTRVAHARSVDVGSIVANALDQAGGNVPIVTEGRDLEFNPPELSWKVVATIVAAAVLLIALKVK